MPLMSGNIDCRNCEDVLNLNIVYAYKLLMIFLGILILL